MKANRNLRLAISTLLGVALGVAAVSCNRGNDLSKTNGASSATLGTNQPGAMSRLE